MKLHGDLISPFAYVRLRFIYDPMLQNQGFIPTQNEVLK